MVITTQPEGTKVLKSYPWYVYILWYYFSINSILFITISIPLASIGDLETLFHGFLLFKYIFCLFSLVLLHFAGYKRLSNTLGSGYVYLCGVYFLLFTLSIYYIIGVKVWKIRSMNEIIPILIDLINELVHEVTEIWQPAYPECFFLTALMVLPTPVLGVYMVIEMFNEYTNPTFIEENDSKTENIGKDVGKKSKKRGGKKKKKKN